MWNTMNIKSFSTLTQMFVSKYFTDYAYYPKLGRWNIQYENHIIHRKIDQANEDHGVFYTQKYTESNQKKEETDEYLFPYCM
jgi:hypothetical protein